MSRIIEEMKKEAMAEKSMEIAKKLLADGISPEKVAVYVELPIGDIKKLQQEDMTKV